MHSWWHLLMKRCGSLIGHAMPVNIHQDNLGMKRLKEVRRLHSCIHIHINWSRRRSRDKAMHIIYMIVPFKIVKPLSHGDFTTGYGFVGIVTEVVHVCSRDHSDAMQTPQHSAGPHMCQFFLPPSVAVTEYFYTIASSTLHVVWPSVKRCGYHLHVY